MYVFTGRGSESLGSRANPVYYLVLFTMRQRMPFTTFVRPKDLQ